MKTAWVAVLTVIVATEATDPRKLVGLKSQLTDFIATKAGSTILAAENLILGGTKAIVTAKQKFFKEQIPHFVDFKTRQLNSLLQLKKTLLSTSAAQIGHIHITSGKPSGELQTPLNEQIIDAPPANPPITPEIPFNVPTPDEPKLPYVLPAPQVTYGVPHATYGTPQGSPLHYQEKYTGQPIRKRGLMNNRNDRIAQ